MQLDHPRGVNAPEQIRRIDHLFRPAEEGHGEVEVVVIDVHQAAARQLGVEDVGHLPLKQAVIAVRALAVIGQHQPDPAQFAQAVLQDLIIGEKGGGYGLGQKQAAVLCQGGQLVHLLSPGTEGLFADDVFVRQQGLPGLLIVEQVGGGDIDDVQIRVMEQIFQPGVHPAGAVLLCQGQAGILPAGVYGVQADALCWTHEVQNGVDNGAGSNGAETKCFHHGFPS